MALKHTLGHTNHLLNTPQLISVTLSRSSEQAECSSLYTEAYRAACRAVMLDRLGHYDQAKLAYSQVIEMFGDLLHAKNDSRVDPRQLQLKRSEYEHRSKQLERYVNSSIAAHPDAQKDSLSAAVESPGGSDGNDTDDDEGEMTETDWHFQKGEFALIQGELNEAKAYPEEALNYYSEAAEWFLKTIKGYEDNPKRKSNARNMFMRAIDKAEEMKALHKQKSNQMTLLAVQNDKGYDGRPGMGRHRASSTASSVRSFVSDAAASGKSVPCPTDEIATQRLSPAEIEVIRITSNVNNRIFLPWDDKSDPKEQYSYENRFIDPEGSLALSAKQLAKFGGWKRPTELMRHPKLIQLISSTSIVQDIVTDCSFVASLCVAAAYERKFKKQLITSCIYPQDKYGQPCYNPSGKYVVKLLYNGISRKIVVDDILPVSREGTLMCTFSTNKEELWASIIEKAYMKLMGGYDFPGSNSGIDLYSLTGWIPEHIFIYDTKHFCPDKVWDRIEEGAKYGDVLVTIATGEMTKSDADRLGLVPTHAYAVIDIKAVMGKRFLQVKNPWSHKRWRGPYSPLDTANWTPELQVALDYDPQVAKRNDDGIFWIDYDSVCSHFSSIHLNWNPELFTHRWVLHSAWPEHIGPKKDTYTLGYNPQFSLKINVPDKKPAAVWLLLSKHVMVTEENTDYITLHVYNDTNGQRVYYPGEPFKEGTYVNSPHILVRFNAPPGTSKYTIVISQHEKVRTLYFSLRAFSLAPFQLAEIPIKHTIEKKIHGQWTEQTAGGNVSNASYMHNPQWKVSIPSNNTGTTSLLVMLEAPKSFAVHLQLIEGGRRVSSVSIRDILAESGQYRHGFCYCELPNIGPGDYTIVASTFEADLLGQFILTVASNAPFEINAIPPEGAGMFRKVLHGEWISGYSAMGCPSYGHYGNNPRYLLEIRELTTVRVRLQADKIEPVPSINVTVYEKHPTELFGREIATSGPYTNAVQGVATGDVVLSQNQCGYIIVLATHDKDIAGEFTVTIYSDRPVNVRNDR